MKTDDFEEYQKKIRKELEEREQKQSEFYRKLGKEAEEIRKKDYETKERIRIEEVSKSGKSLLVYAIEKLLEKSILYKNKNIEVSFYELGFGNYRDGRHFLNILKRGDKQLRRQENHIAQYGNHHGKPDCVIAIY